MDDAKHYKHLRYSKQSWHIVALAFLFCVGATSHALACISDLGMDPLSAKEHLFRADIVFLGKATDQTTEFHRDEKSETRSGPGGLIVRYEIVKLYKGPKTSGKYLDILILGADLHDKKTFLKPGEEGLLVARSNKTIAAYLDKEILGLRSFYPYFTMSTGLMFANSCNVHGGLYQNPKIRSYMEGEFQANYQAWQTGKRKLKIQKRKENFMKSLAVVGFALLWFFALRDWRKRRNGRGISGSIS